MWAPFNLAMSSASVFTPAMHFPDTNSAPSRGPETQRFVCARWKLLPQHVGFGPDGARLSEALLVLLGLANRWPGAATASSPIMCRCPPLWRLKAPFSDGSWIRRTPPCTKT